MKNKNDFYLTCSGFFIDDLDHVHNWVGRFTKPDGKDYVNVKP